MNSQIKLISTDLAGAFFAEFENPKIRPYDAEADARALEREINQLVCARYGLALEEIKLAEGAAK